VLYATASKRYRVGVLEGWRHHGVVLRDRRRLDKGLLVASFVIAAGLALIVWGVGSAITGDDGIDRPEAIETLSPVENAIQVLQQERIVVDFEFGYEAELIIDGIPIPTSRIGEFTGEVEPGEQLTIPPTAVFDPGNSRIEFQPSEDGPIESFTEGRHEVRVIFWRIDEGRENARSYTWSFDVI
jgi:hypothetical protein